MTKKADDAVILTSLEVENFMRVKAFSVEFGDPGWVALEADNSVGKTSILTALRSVFGGAKELPPDPVRHGADESVIIATSNLLVSKMTIPKNGKPKLEVRPNEEGAKKLGSPQAVHDELTGMFIDPEEFDHMTGPKRAAVLNDLSGVDPTKHDAKRDKIFKQRTDVNRDLKSAEARLAALPPNDADVPAKEISVTKLAGVLEQMQESNAENEKQRQSLVSSRKVASEVAATVKSLAAQLEEAQARLDLLHTKGKKLRAKCDALEDDDTEELVAQIGSAEKTNKRVRSNAARVVVQAEVSEQASASEALTKKIDAIDTKKKKEIDGAKYPIKGVEVRDGEAYLNGVPWGQAGAAERLKASTEMGFAIHPRLKFLMIKNGSLLSNKSRAIVGKMARKVGGHVLMEVVGDSSEIKVIYEGK